MRDMLPTCHHLPLVTHWIWTHHDFDHHRAIDDSDRVSPSTHDLPGGKSWMYELYGWSILLLGHRYQKGKKCHYHFTRLVWWPADRGLQQEYCSLLRRASLFELLELKKNSITVGGTSGGLCKRQVDQRGMGFIYADSPNLTTYLYV